MPVFAFRDIAPAADPPTTLLTMTEPADDVRVIGLKPAPEILPAVVMLPLVVMVNGALLPQLEVLTVIAAAPLLAIFTVPRLLALMPLLAVIANGLTPETIPA